MEALFHFEVGFGLEGGLHPKPEERQKVPSSLFNRCAGASETIHTHMYKSLLKVIVHKPYSPPKVDRIWLWVYSNKFPIYLIFYLLKGDYNP